MPIWVKNSGVWKETTPHVRDGGVWKEVSPAWVKSGGVWKKAHEGEILLESFEDWSNGTGPLDEPDGWQLTDDYNADIEKCERDDYTVVEGSYNLYFQIYGGTSYGSMHTLDKYWNNTDASNYNYLKFWIKTNCSYADARVIFFDENSYSWERWRTTSTLSASWQTLDISSLNRNGFRIQIKGISERSYGNCRMWIDAFKLTN